MKRSLRVSVFFFIFVANLLVFGAGFVWLTGTLSRYRRRQETDFTNLLVERMQYYLIDAKSIQAAGILRWSYWAEFEDAVVVHLPGSGPEETGPGLPGEDASRLPAGEPSAGEEPPLEGDGERATVGAEGASLEAGAALAEQAAAPGSALEADPLVEQTTAPVAGSGEPELALASALPELDGGGATEAPPSAPALPARRIGVILNPLGRGARPVDFDWEAVLGGIEAAVADGTTHSTQGGAVVPILDPRGRAWGGCWFRLKPRFTLASLARQLVPWLVFSTLSLTLATFFVLQRLVLEPVELLARASRRLAVGDRSVELPEPRGGDELSQLMRTFALMAREVRDSSDRLAEEVAVATEKARRAEAAAMLQRRLAATGELAAGIAHEINNPLGGMMNAVEVLGRPDLDPNKRRTYLELLENGLERIRSTVGQVLRLAPRTSRFEPLAIRGPIEDALGLSRHRIQREGVALSLVSRGQTRRLDEPDACRVLDGLPLVRGAANELGQVVLNLLANALDALASLPPELRATRGRIVLSAEAQERELLLVVEDDGPGMASEEVARAADPFFTTKASGRGTGLGLTIVQNMVASHGGRLEIASRPGQGFRVEIALPLYEREPRREA